LSLAIAMPTWPCAPQFCCSPSHRLLPRS